MRARHSCLPASKVPGRDDLSAGARTSTLTSWTLDACRTTKVAGFWSVAPFGGTMLTFRRSAASAESVPRERPLTPPLLPPQLVASTATPAIRARPTTLASEASRKGLLLRAEPDGWLCGGNSPTSNLRSARCTARTSSTWFAARGGPASAHVQQQPTSPGPQPNAAPATT